MAAIPKVWSAAEVVYATDAYSGEDADVSTIATLADVDFVAGGSGVDAENKHGFSLKVKVNSGGTTDNFEIVLLASEDGTEFDTVTNALAIMTIVATSGNDSIRTWLIPAVARHMRVQGRRSGSTDTFDVEVTITPYTFGS